MHASLIADAELVGRRAIPEALAASFHTPTEGALLMLSNISIVCRRLWAPALVLLSVCFVADAAQAASRTGKPNVLVIITDDQGYADVGFHGCKDIPTPHIDALAHGGVECTNGYVTCPVCAPSRAGLMSGRYQQRSGFQDNSWSAKTGLSTNATTMADVLKANGYSTLAIGKWHLGQLPQYRPLVRGFTDHFGFYGGGRSYFPIKDSLKVPFVPKDPMQTGLWCNQYRVDDPPYVTDAFGDEAVSYIHRHKNQPFFIYLCFNAPHVPLQATDKYLARFPNLKGLRRTYAAVVSAADDAIGRVNDALRAEGLEENTLVFFISDNGGHPPANAANNLPLRGQKGTLYEGGIRVPFVVKWPKQLPAGTKFDRPVISLDFMATALAAAGTQPPSGVPLDGVDLVPHLRGDNKERPHQTLYWRFIKDRAIRYGDWKLTMPVGKPEGLFNLAKDISESTDLSAANPEIVKKLKGLHAAWEAQMPPAEIVPPGPRKWTKPLNPKSETN